MPRKGFTLIELLVVISIIALLSSVVLASLNAARDKARIAAGRQFDAQAGRVAGDSAVGIWDLDEGTGSAVADRSGNGNSGTFTGATWSSDTQSGRGYSASFNGTSARYVLVPYSPELAPTAAVTVSAWFKASALSGEAAFVTRTETGGYSIRYGHGSNGCAASGICFQIFINSGYIGVNHAFSSVGSWHHVLATYDGSVAKLFVDGREVGRHAIVGTIGYAVTQPLCIGSEATGSTCTDGHYFNGLIDDVRVYAKALTASEASAAYAQGLESLRVAGKL